MILCTWLLTSHEHERRRAHCPFFHCLMADAFEDGNDAQDAPAVGTAHVPDEEPLDMQEDLPVHDDSHTQEGATAREDALVQNEAGASANEQQGRGHPTLLADLHRTNTSYENDDEKQDSDSDGDEENFHDDDTSFGTPSSARAPAASTPPQPRATKHQLEHTPKPQPKRVRSVNVDESDEAVEEVLGNAQSSPQLDEYLPVPFPHKSSETTKPDIPEPNSVTVLDWIKQQQAYLLAAMRERIDSRLSNMRNRNNEQRARLEKKLRSM